MLNSAGVDWSGFRDTLAQHINALGRASVSVLILDESAIAKEGAASADVAHQWNGGKGKLDNCRKGGPGRFATKAR